MRDSCNPVHLRISVLTFFSREVKEPYNRFICTINKSFPRVKRERGRKEKKKRPLNQWSMRWLYLTSKTSWAVQAEFWLSFCSFSGWSEARDVPQSSLEAYPCCCKQKDPNNTTFSQSGATCQWLFSPILPLFPSFLAFIFIGRLVLYPAPSGPQVKEASFSHFLLWRGACWEYLWLLISEVV